MLPSATGTPKEGANDTHHKTIKHNEAYLDKVTNNLTQSSQRSVNSSSSVFEYLFEVSGKWSSRKNEFRENLIIVRNELEMKEEILLGTKNS